MTPSQILALFRKTCALMRGHFLLSSGLHSGHYVQCMRVLEYPVYAERLAKALARPFARKRVTVVAGPALGGITLAYEVARALKVRAIFGERATEGSPACPACPERQRRERQRRERSEWKDDAMTLRRGFVVGAEDRVLVVEDVVTTGGSVKELAEAIRQHGAHVVGIGALIDRSTKPPDFGVPFHALLRFPMEAFAPGECPLCQEGVPILKPGSRKRASGG